MMYLVFWKEIQPIEAFADDVLCFYKQTIEAFRTAQKLEDFEDWRLEDFWRLVSTKAHVAQKVETSATTCISENIYDRVGCACWNWDWPLADRTYVTSCWKYLHLRSNVTVWILFKYALNAKHAREGHED